MPDSAKWSVYRVPALPLLLLPLRVNYSPKSGFRNRVPNRDNLQKTGLDRVGFNQINKWHLPKLRLA